MRNVDEKMLKKCVFMPFEQYQKLVLNLTDGLKCVEHEIDGIFYEDTDKAENSDTYWNEDITETLSKYFDTTVTSVHTDDCDYLGVWICYKN